MPSRLTCQIILWKGGLQFLAHINGKTVAKAIRYTTSRWNELTCYTTDGRLEMSSNAVERSIRPLALGRKNHLFAGSDAGGKRAAAIFTLIETARMNDLNAQVLLSNVINRIADQPDHRAAAGLVDAKRTCKRGIVRSRRASERSRLASSAKGAE